MLACLYGFNVHHLRLELLRELLLRTPKRVHHEKLWVLHLDGLQIKLRFLFISARSILLLRTHIPIAFAAVKQKLSPVVN